MTALNKAGLALVPRDIHRAGKPVGQADRWVRMIPASTGGPSAGGSSKASAENPFALNPTTEDGGRRLGLNPTRHETELDSWVLSDADTALLNEMDEEDQFAAADDVRATPVLLVALVDTPHDKVRLAVAGNSNTPAVALRYLAGNWMTNDEAREAIAVNENTDDDTLSAFMMDGSGERYSELASDTLGRRLKAWDVEDAAAEDRAAGWEAQH